MIAGITAEYDPLHNGHLHHIEETRRITSCDALVVAMSGDFVQRGEPAVCSKWARTEHALKAGADLVVEIPTLFCLGNASQYAAASVSILESAGCSVISFGSESGDTDILRKTAGVLRSESVGIEEYISRMIKEGKSWPAARSEAYREIRKKSVSAEELEAELAVLENPNDILALEYMMHMKSAGPLAVKRAGSAYSGSFDSSAEHQSASAIRGLIREKGFDGCRADLLDFIPSYSMEPLGKAVFPDDCFDILKYAALSTDAAVIDECPSGGEGLGNLMKSAVKDAAGFDDLVLRMKSKRYTYTRISRLCMQLMLGISRQEYGKEDPGYIRVLGMNKKGREVIAAAKKTSGLPVITNINKEKDKLDGRALSQLELDIHAAGIYGLISGEKGQTEQRMKPVML